MIVKVEVYFEVRKKEGEIFPDHPGLLIEKQLEEEIPKEFTLKGDWWTGKQITANYLTRKRALELLVQGPRK